LRECQIDAVTGLEKSFARQHPRALVQMATGAGKTWMAVTECYRLIKFGGAQRILFLVDRANLGKQAKNEFRVTVTVDMIATGTDIKPLEIVLSDVRSAVYYEQMKGRGTRVIDPHELCTVTPDAKAKTHFVLVDAVGVTQRTKSASHPIERAPNVSFEKLLDKVARGNRTDQTLSSLASRLLRLDAALEPADRERVRAQCGQMPDELAHPLGESVDPDLQVTEARRANGLRADAEPTAPQTEAAATALKEAAVKPFHDPDLRTLLVELQARAEITVDHLSPDTIIEGTGYDACLAGNDCPRCSKNSTPPSPPESTPVIILTHEQTQEVSP
jgi:type I restriction enzyme R subunit